MIQWYWFQVSVPIQKDLIISGGEGGWVGGGCVHIMHILPFVNMWH